MTESRGAALAQLLISGFEALITEVVAELDRQGHPRVTATHEFALVAIEAGADTASALGRQLEVSKQAAAKTILALDQLGYVDKHADPLDARRTTVTVNERGREMMTLGAVAFDRLRDRLIVMMGASEVATMERVLSSLGSTREVRKL